MYAPDMPRSLFRVLFIILATLCLVPAGCGGEEDAEIRDVFDVYLAALEKRDVATFMKHVDPQVIERYGGYVRLAQKGSKAQILGLPPSSMLQVLVLRHRVPPETLQTLTGESWVRLAIQESWFDLDSEDEVQEFRLGRITHRSPRASADLLADGDKTGTRVEFVKVEGAWLINDECFGHWFDKALEKLAARVNLPQIDVLFRLESEESGKRVDPAIFDKPPQF